MQFRELEEAEERTRSWNKRKGMMVKFVLVVGVLMIVGSTVPKKQVVPAVRSLFSGKSAQVSSDIRGGSAAAVGDFPEVVGISFQIRGQGSRSKRCTGVRVRYDEQEDGEVIATAGHCCKEETYNHKIWPGIKLKSQSVTAYEAHWINLYKDYAWPDPEKKNSPQKDLCVIITHKKMKKLPEGIDYPKLADKAPASNTRVWIAGFGMTSATDHNLAGNLYKAKVRIRTSQECAAGMTDAGIQNAATITPDVVCAKEKNFGKDNTGCVGDSGGPLFSADRSGGSYTLYGILSDGKRNCTKIPTWFSKVYKKEFGDFIKKPTDDNAKIREEYESDSHRKSIFSFLM